MKRRLTPREMILSALAILVAIVLTLTWVLAIGLYAHQFNDADDEGYPELFGRYHL